MTGEIAASAPWWSDRRLGSHSRHRRTEVDPLPVRPQQPVRSVGGMQVVIEDPSGGGLPRMLGNHFLGKLCGISAQEVMERLPIRCGFGKQMRVGARRSGGAGPDRGP